MAFVCLCATMPPGPLQRVGMNLPNALGRAVVSHLCHTTEELFRKSMLLDEYFLNSAPGLSTKKSGMTQVVGRHRCRRCLVAAVGAFQYPPKTNSRNGNQEELYFAFVHHNINRVIIYFISNWLVFTSCYFLQVNESLILFAEI